MTFEAAKREAVKALAAISAGGLLSRYDLARACFLVSKEVQWPRAPDHTRSAAQDLLLAIVDQELVRVIRTYPADLAYELTADSARHDPEQVACVIDPLAYLSHLSAMAHHGLTERLPQIVYLTSPARAEWNRRATERTRSDLGEDYGDFKNARLPSLTKVAVRRVLRSTIDIYSSSRRYGRHKLVRHRRTRVGTIGQTFMDMITSPDRCGGIYHVIEVIAESLPKYAQLVIPYVDKRGGAIDKVRMGYLLEERCGIHHPTIEGWIVYATRGGSRKLDPSAEYDGESFSERWSLSINV